MQGYKSKIQKSFKIASKNIVAQSTNFGLNGPELEFQLCDLEQVCQIIDSSIQLLPHKCQPPFLCWELGSSGLKELTSEQNSRRVQDDKNTMKCYAQSARTPKDHQKN